jgi:hypothetical protein
MTSSLTRSASLREQEASGGVPPPVLRQIDPLCGGHWDELSADHPDQNVFHTSAWARVLHDTYGHRPCYLNVTVARSTVALLPIMEVCSPLTGRRGVSLPFSDCGGPLFFKHEALGATFRALAEFARLRRWRHLELRGGPAPPEVKPALIYGGHRLDLTRGLERVEAGLKPSTRRCIRRAQRSGLTVEIERSEKAMSSYYGLHTLTRRRHGLPPQPFSFFRSVARHLVGPGSGFIVLVRRRGRPVAGAVFLGSGETVVYKFGASDPASLGDRPNHLVLWSAIENLVSSGCRWLHFGRSHPSAEGLLRFKYSWGAEYEPLSLFRYHVSSRSWLANCAFPAESHRAVFGWMPSPMSRFAGSLLYPHLD